jgi:hypothetical protein
VLDTGFGRQPRGAGLHHDHWDDIRYFLAVARGGSVRAAAERLGVNTLDRAATHRPVRGMPRGGRI